LRQISGLVNRRARLLACRVLALDCCPMTQVRQFASYFPYKKLTSDKQSGLLRMLRRVICICCCCQITHLQCFIDGEVIQRTTIKKMLY
jgi:hypothetical protein